MNKSKKRGFTLIELLVVVAVIVIISAVIIANIASSRQKSRDARRISDIGQIQLALEQYYDRCSQYPSTLSNTSMTSINNGCLSGVSLASFISVIPTAPSGGSSYAYAIKDSDKSDYVLRAVMEGTNNDIMRNSLGNFTIPSGYTSYVIPGTGLYGGSFPCDTTIRYCIGPK